MDLVSWSWFYTFSNYSSCIETVFFTKV